MGVFQCPCKPTNMKINASLAGVSGSHTVISNHKNQYSDLNFCHKLYCFILE